MIRRIFTTSAISRAAKVVAAIAFLAAATAPTARAAPTVPASPNGRVTVQTLAASGPGSLAAAVAGSGSGARNESVVIDFATFPCDVPRPNTSSLNFEPGGVGGNEVVIELAPGGDLCIFASAEHDVTLDLTAELR